MMAALLQTVNQVGKPEPALHLLFVNQAEQPVSASHQMTQQIKGMGKG
jgi:hypothetical protein